MQELFQAVREIDLLYVKRNVDVVENINEKNSDGDTLLHVVVNYDNCSRLFCDGETHNKFCEQTDCEFGDDNCADVIEGAETILQYLLEHPDIDPSIRNKDGKTALELITDFRRKGFYEQSFRNTLLSRLR